MLARVLKPELIRPTLNVSGSIWIRNLSNNSSDPKFRDKWSSSPLLNNKSKQQPRKPTPEEIDLQNKASKLFLNFKKNNTDFKSKKDLQEASKLLNSRTPTPPNHQRPPPNNGPPNPPKKPENGPEGPEFKLEININHIMWALMGIFIVYTAYSDTSHIPEITFNEFKQRYLANHEVAKLEVVNNHLVRVYLQNTESYDSVFTVGSVDCFEQFMNEAQDELEVPLDSRIPVNYINEGGALSTFLNLVPSLIFLAFLIYVGKQTSNKAQGINGMINNGKSKAQLFDPNSATQKVKFKDIAGMDEAKREIMEFVEYLKAPSKFERIGAKLPRGAILSGAPGTGKTMLAKATAAEAKVPFYSVSGSEFVEMFSGVGSSRVRDLFKKAKEQAPSMIWIDEIDAIGKARSTGFRGNDEREATLNQLLVEMDGFDSNDQVVVLAGTNRADMLDKALLRPGRFDRHINIDLPSLEGRKQIFSVHLAKIKYDKSIKELNGKLAAMTPGFSGADIANCCNEAALLAARDNAKQIVMSHFELAVDRVIAGLAKDSKVLTKEKRNIVAHHEAGHAVAGWFLKYADPLVKVTIVPHGGSTLGYAQLLPSDSHIITKTRMFHLMVVALGGRVSEEMFFNSVTVGAGDDFKKVTDIAKSMVCEYGFSTKVGSLGYKYTDNSNESYSEEKCLAIDSEITKLIENALAECRALLNDKKQLIIKVANDLLAKEQLTRSDLVRLLGERPFKDNEHEAFKKYLDVN